MRKFIGHNSLMKHCRDIRYMFAYCFPICLPSGTVELSACVMYPVMVFGPELHSTTSVVKPSSSIRRIRTISVFLHLSHLLLFLCVSLFCSYHIPDLSWSVLLTKSTITLPLSSSYSLFTIHDFAPYVVIESIVQEYVNYFVIIFRFRKTVVLKKGIPVTGLGDP